MVVVVCWGVSSEAARVVSGSRGGGGVKDTSKNLVLKVGGGATTVRDVVPLDGLNGVGPGDFDAAKV